MAQNIKPGKVRKVKVTKTKGAAATNIWRARLIDMGLAALLTLILTAAIGRMFMITITVGFIVSCLLFFVPALLLLHIKIARRIVQVGVLAIAIISILQLMATGSTFWLPRLVDYFHWVGEFINAGNFYHMPYINFAYGMITFAILIGMYFCMRLQINAPIYMASVVVFLGQSFNDPSFNLFWLTMFIFVIGIVIARQSYARHADKGGGKALFGALPLTIAMVILVSILPKPSDPLNLPAMEDLLHFLGLGHLTGQLQGPGFGAQNLADGTLGGPFRGNDLEILRVTNGYQTYLRAHVFEEYTGSQWRNRAGSVRNFTHIHHEALAVAGSTRFMSIQYVNLNTNIVVQPPHLIRITGIERTILQNTRDFLQLHDRVSGGFTYTAFSFNPRMTVEEFESILRGQKDPLYFFNGYEDLQTALQRGMRPDHNQLQIPESVPQRVRNLAREITAPYDNDFDRANALVAFLRYGNFYYYTDMPLHPRGEDFVDMFLFEHQRGYCTYFASAFVIMARAAGMHARYVSGFVLRPDPNATAQNVYFSTGMDAHAWGEIWFNGLGWVMFEPTPGRSDSLPPPVQPPRDPNNPPTPMPSPIDPADPTPSPSPSPVPSPSAPVTPTTPPPTNGYDDSGRTPFTIPTQVWWILGGLLLVVGTGWFIIEHNSRRVKKITTGGPDGVKLLWKTILVTMPRFGLGKAKNETLREYAERLTAELAPLELRPYATMLDALTYGGLEPQEAPYADFFRDWKLSLKLRSKKEYVIARMLLRF